MVSTMYNKCKAIHAKNGNWVHGYHIQTNDEDFLYLENGDIVLVKKETISFPTGLKGWEGEMIYLGDVLSGVDSKYIVEWEKEKAMYVLRMEDFPEGEEMYSYNLKEMPIIGNALANPQIFEAEKNL